MSDGSSFLGGRVRVLVGDVTKERVDAVVNAANAELEPGGGVDGALTRAAGPAALTERRRLRDERFGGRLPTGAALLAPGGDLPARFLVHAVGPVWGAHAGEEESLLASAYRSSLAAAADAGAETIAFPAISTGIYGFPRAAAAAAASRAITEFLAGDGRIREVRLVFFSRDDAEVFLSSHLFPG